MSRRRDRALTPMQEQIVGYINAEGPVTVATVASSMRLSESAARSRLATLERRSLVDRQFTGTSRGVYAYVITAKGAEAAHEAFGEKPDEELSDEPYPVKITETASGVFRRAYPLSLGLPSFRNLTWDRLNPTEQAAMTAARATGAPVTVGCVTANPKKESTS